MILQDQSKNYMAAKLHTAQAWLGLLWSSLAGCRNNYETPTARHPARTPRAVEAIRPNKQPSFRNYSVGTTEATMFSKGVGGCGRAGRPHPLSLRLPSLERDSPDQFEHLHIGGFLDIESAASACARDVVVSIARTGRSFASSNVKC
jgi:hypothetical protein